MNAFVAVLFLASAATAAPSVTITKVGFGTPEFVRAPAHDSASIEFHRLGGNFAFSTAERHAHASVTPEISVATHPVAETTYTHQPAAVKTVQPAAVVHTTHAARPIIGQQAILAKEAVIGPVATHTQVHQPLIKRQHVHYTQPLAQVQHHTVVAAAPSIKTVAAVGTAAAVPTLAAVDGYATGYATGLTGYTVGGAIPAVAGAIPAVAGAIPAGYAVGGAIPVAAAEGLAAYPAIKA